MSFRITASTPVSLIARVATDEQMVGEASHVFTFRRGQRVPDGL